MWSDHVIFDWYGSYVRTCSTFIFKLSKRYTYVATGEDPEIEAYTVSYNLSNFMIHIQI